MIYGNFLGLPSSFWIPMIIFWIICGICCGIIANNKGYDSTYYGIAIVVGCLFGVFAMIFYASAKDLDMEKEIKDLTHKVGKLEYERAIKLYEAEDKPIKATSKVEKKETKAVATKEVKEDLSKLTVAELKKLAKEKGISGYSTMKKADIIDALK